MFTLMVRKNLPFWNRYKCHASQTKYLEELSLEKIYILKT